MVTGGAKRVGRAIALTLARAGMDIVLHYNRSETAAVATAAEIRAMGKECTMVSADLQDAKSVDALLASAELSHVDVLVNSASVFFRTPIETVTAEEWDRVMAVNLRAPFFLAQRLGLAMKQRGHGKIINIADCSARRPYRNYLPYIVSKGAIVTMTQALALEFAPEVQVNCVAPGTVLLPESKEFDKLRGPIEKRTPLKRIGSPEDVAKMVLFLVKEGEFMTGGYYPVDGGAGIGGG